MKCQHKWHIMKKGEEDGMYRSKGLNESPFCGIYADLAKVLDEESVNKIYEYFRGQQVNFPMHLYTIDYVAQIAIESENAANVKKLARDYGYSERHLVRIIKQIVEKRQTQ